MNDTGSERPARAGARSRRAARWQSSSRTTAAPLETVPRDSGGGKYRGIVLRQRPAGGPVSGGHLPDRSGRANPVPRYRNRISQRRHRGGAFTDHHRRARAQARLRAPGICCPPHDHGSRAEYMAGSAESPDDYRPAIFGNPAPLRCMESESGLLEALPGAARPNEVAVLRVPVINGRAENFEPRGTPSARLQRAARCHAGHQRHAGQPPDAGRRAGRPGGYGAERQENSYRRRAISTEP